MSVITTVETVARALHKHACKKARSQGGQKGVEWIPWKSLPEFAQREYRERAEFVVNAVRKARGARPAQDKNQVEALNAEIAYLRQANLTMASQRDAWKDTALAHKARLDEFTVSVEVQKPKTRKPEGPITTGIRTFRAEDGTYSAEYGSIGVGGYRSRSGARHAMIAWLRERGE